MVVVFQKTRSRATLIFRFELIGNETLAVRLLPRPLGRVQPGHDEKAPF